MGKSFWEHGVGQCHGRQLMGWRGTSAHESLACFIIFFLLSFKHMLNGCYRVASWKAVVGYNKSTSSISPRLLSISLSLSLSPVQVPGDSPVYHLGQPPTLLLSSSHPGNLILKFISPHTPSLSVRIVTVHQRRSARSYPVCFSLNVFMFELGADPLFIRGDSQALMCKW